MSVRLCSHWTSQTLMVGVQDGITILEYHLIVYIKVNMYTLYIPANLHPGIHPTEKCTYIPKNTGTRIFIIAFIIIAQNQKQRKDPSIGEWVNNLINCGIQYVNIYVYEYTHTHMHTHIDEYILMQYQQSTTKQRKSATK